MKYQVFKNSTHSVFHSDKEVHTKTTDYVHENGHATNYHHRVLTGILILVFGLLVASILLSYYATNNESTQDSEDPEIQIPDNENECVYDLSLGYTIGAPDGVTKHMLTFNDQFPGPTLRCMRGKFLVVRVTNNLDEPTSVHWHGIEQSLSPFFDGPEGVTQCPILPGTNMIYRFQLFQTGTYWYHSHHSLQYVDGAWGVIIIDNTHEVWADLYDEELTITLNDWHHLPTKLLYERYLVNETDFPFPDSHLINGKGSYSCAQAIAKGMQCNPSAQVPAVINVLPGRRYRIRVLNTSASTRFNFSIDGHKLQTIETDGVDTVLVPPVDMVQIWTAQRYSFILTANGTLDEYWIRAAGNFNDQPGLAVLKYDRLSVRENRAFGKPKTGTLKQQHLRQGRPARQTFEWKRMTDDRACDGGKRKRTYNKSKRNFKTLINRPEMSYTVDNTNLRLPRSIPCSNSTMVILDHNTCRPYHYAGQSTAPDYYDRLITINAQTCSSGSTDNRTRLCFNDIQYIPGSEESTPVLFQMIAGKSISSSIAHFHTPYLNEVVQVVINNRNIRAHPWHMHGHTFWVVGTGAPGQGDYVAERDADSLTTHGVRRDTTHTLRNSWVVLRYLTGNPGAWFLHCHISWHLASGFGAVLIEGQKMAQDLYCDPPEEAVRVCRRVGVHV